MPGVSFDRAATFYDATRGYAPGVAEQIRAGIHAYVGATPATRFLELGVGTGRVALPFIQAGDDFTGVDISEAMMQRLREKIAAKPGASAGCFELLNADVTQLPFADATFDVVYAVHVLHLVSDRQQTIREAQRVLKSGGVFLSASDGPEENEGDEIPPRQVRTMWLDTLHEMRVLRSPERSRWITDEIVERDLKALGAQVETIKLAEYERPSVSARQMADLIAARSFSSDWETSDEDHAEALRRVEDWMTEEIANPDEPYRMRGDVIAVAGTWKNEPPMNADERR